MKSQIIVQLAVLYLAKGKNFQANHNSNRKLFLLYLAVLYLAKGKNFQANHNATLPYPISIMLCFT